VNDVYSDIKILRAESAQYDEAIERAKELEQLRGQLSKTLESFSDADLEKLEHFLPKNIDTVRIVLDVDGIADRNSIRLNNLRVTDTGLTAKPNANATRGVAAQAGKQNYNTVEVSFNFSTSYSHGVDFIEDLQRSLRLLDTASITVKPDGENSNNYNFDMKMQTYWIDR